MDGHSLATSNPSSNSKSTSVEALMRASQTIVVLPLLEVVVVTKRGINIIRVQHIPRVLTSNRVFSAIILWKPIPTPSMTANRQPHAMAELRADLHPPLIARAPPVKKPAITIVGPK